MARILVLVLTTYKNFEVVAICGQMQKVVHAPKLLLFAEISTLILHRKQIPRGRSGTVKSFLFREEGPAVKGVRTSP